MVNNVDRTSFVLYTERGTTRPMPLRKLLVTIDENPNAAEYQNTWGLLSVAQAFVGAGFAKKIDILFDGNPILTTGGNES